MLKQRIHKYDSFVHYTATFFHVTLTLGKGHHHWNTLTFTEVYFLFDFS